MAKVKSVFICQECGAKRPKWEGRCGDCGAWNSFVEEREVAQSKSSGGRGWQVKSAEFSEPVRLSDARPQSQPKERVSSGLQEFDRVLGGGLVNGSYTLLGGDPGIGKSTLLLQLAGGLALQGRKVLYVSAEESVEQTALRASRLGLQHLPIEIASESQMEVIVNLAETLRPDLLVVDSIQTVYLQDIQSAPGSVSQVRECAARLMSLAKSSGVCVFIIGHVTKEGALAGPRVLEHMVDTVLSFEGDTHHQFRLLRALKNRFGATNELGVFQMIGSGLAEILNPSEFFLEERGTSLIGSAVFAAIEGSRPLLCEIQALSNATPMPSPRRTAIGVDVNRLHMILAVLDKHLDLQFSHSDIYVNVVGGLKLTEPAADLAAAAALISTATSQEIPRSVCFFGEIGLTGEVRASVQAVERVKEAKKLGFDTVVLPEKVRKQLAAENISGVNLRYIQNVGQLEAVLGKSKSRPTPASSKEFDI